MLKRGLWLSFLEEADGGPGPRLRTGAAPGAPEIALTDRARWVLAAIALPRELAPETASDEQQRARLGSRLWSSGEIMARIPYQHRSTIRHAMSDLRQRLAEHELELDDYLLLDTARGRYSLRCGAVTVDLVELHEIRDDPAACDRYLDSAVADRRRAQLAPVCAHLLDDDVHHELAAAISASAARALAPAAEPAPPVGPPPLAQPGHSSQSDPASRSQPSAAPQHPRTRPDSPAWRRRLTPLAVGLATTLAAAIALVIVLQPGDRSQAATGARGPSRIEVAGGVAHTWSNPRTAGGRPGPEIFGRERVRIACRVHGFTVQDGNSWWYLIASRPWSRRYFVTADAFYNNGHVSGSLRGSAFVDKTVARCSALPRSAS